MAARILLVETSQRVGAVALAVGNAIVAERALDESRRHARDLVPAIKELLDSQKWRAQELDGVVVSRGPGSYTGLRVGIMSAKTLAYVTGCPLLAVGTFDAIYQETDQAIMNTDVIADAQQGNIYVQRFGKHPEPLAVFSFEMWLESAVAWNANVTGPGVEIFANRLPKSLTVVPRDTWFPQPSGLLKVALGRIEKGERDDPFVVEPLYVRASSAEQKWQMLHPS